MLGRYTTGPRPVADDSRSPARPPPRRRAQHRATGEVETGRDGSYTPRCLPVRHGDASRGNGDRPMTLSAYPAARDRARERWHVLGDRLRTIRPEGTREGHHRPGPDRRLALAGRGIVAGPHAVRRRRGPRLCGPARREPPRCRHAARLRCSPRGARCGRAAGWCGGRRGAPPAEWPRYRRSQAADTR